MFFVGQKVVCVRLHKPTDSRLKVGGIYTVAAIDSQPPALGIDVVEEPAAKQPGFAPPCLPFYWAKLFRPAVERKTDISIFTKMLTPDKRRINA